jgi:hypothetical protein
MLALLVAAYFISLLGMPVYFHYCGGELEDISYFMKADGCCEGEDNSGEGPDDCCSNEDLYVVNSADFTAKSSSGIMPLKMLGELACLPVLSYSDLLSKFSVRASQFSERPPGILQDHIITTSVLRI